MKVCDLTIAFRGATLEKVATVIHERIGYRFVPRTSSYLGGDYYFSVNGHEETRVHLNRDGEQIAEEEYPEYGVLVQVDSCHDAHRWKSLLSELDGVLIRENSYEV